MTGTRCRAPAAGTSSAGVRRPGRKPASACATVRVVKNSRPASAFVATPTRSRQPQDARHRTERHLSKTADRGTAHDLLKFGDALVHLGGDPRTAAAREVTGQDLVRLGRADAARDALAAGLVAEEAQYVGRGSQQIGAFG